MAKDATTPTAASVDSESDLRKEIETLKAQNEKLSDDLRNAIGVMNSLRSELDHQSEVSKRTTMASRIEDARRAQQISADTIAKQSRGRNDGQYGWRIAIKGYKQPLIMWCDKSDVHDAMAVFNNRYGTQFDGKKMTITPINQGAIKELQTVA